MRPWPLLLVLVYCAVCGTSDNSNIATLADFAMTMPYRIVVGDSLAKDRRQTIQQIIDATFAEVDQRYNKWNPQSELSTLNQAVANEKIPLSSELYAFLIETGRIVHLTEGRFDPTVEPIQRLWKQHLERGAIPSSEAVDTAATGVGWDKVHLEGGFFWKETDQTELDLGAIAKGYAIDLIVERLNAAGFPDIYVEWGGEIRVSGRHPEGRPWKVAVSKFGPQGAGAPVAVVELHDKAVASSGDYLQNWTVKGKTYCHILDPKGKCPLELTSQTVCSATVVAPSCMLADALATAAMLFPSPAASREWLRTIPGMRFWVFSRQEKGAKKPHVP